uniref:G protein-coupled receptor n=1 Tax=Pristionchus pacificus TaxID=54126 RepID=A0A2A6BHT2_PRIPA|eukprot:PDM65452.1 G protein-coupled receptor [Pristionchus pacificus]
MASIFGEYEWPIYIVTAVFLVLTTLGIFFNSLVVFATVQTKPIICIPPEAFYGEAKMLWSITSCIVYVAAVLVYCVVWAVLKRQQNMAAMTKIFRSLFIIMLVVVLGWMLTMSGVLIASLVFHLEGMKMYFLHETVGLFVNTSLVLNYFVYYKTRAGGKVGPDGMETGGRVASERMVTGGRVMVEGRCSSFSFQDKGLSSSWVLLSSKASDQTCTDQTTIFLKKKSGCPDKSKLYVIRAIDVHGRRITLDNERHNYIRKMGTGLFEWDVAKSAAYGKAWHTQWDTAHLTADSVHEYVHKVGKDYGIDSSLLFDSLIISSDHCLTLFLPRPVVFFTDFTTVKDALITQGDNFTGRSQLPPEIYLQPEVQTGVAISDGEVWREQRRISLRIMREHGMGKNSMEAQVNRAIDEMLAHIKSINNGADPIDLTLPLQLCVGNVINETIFGYLFKHTDLSVFEFAMKIVTLHMQIVRDNIWVLLVQAWPWTKHLPIIGKKGYREPIENIAKYHKFIQQEINEIERSYDRSQEPTNFVQSYLREMERNSQLDLKNLNAIVVDFWIAGSETLSATLRWAILLFTEYPEIQEKMRDELNAVVGRNRRIEMADKPNLPYFCAAITEIQRWSNILPFPQFHRCTADSIIGGKLVPKDTLTLPQIHSVMRNQIIFPNPDEFRPERFLEEDGRSASKVLINTSEMKNPPSFSPPYKFPLKHAEHFVAFGMGKRQCLGESLARMELFLILGTLLLNYRFEKTEPSDMTPVFGSIIAPRPQKCNVVPI